MPCCGLTFDFLYERLKAAEADGSEVAKQLIDDFLFPQEDEPEAADTGEGRRGKTLARKTARTRCRTGQRLTEGGADGR